MATGLVSGSVQIVDDPRPLLKQIDSHPYHHHPLMLNTRSGGPCQVCSKHKHQVPVLLSYLVDQEDTSVMYSCRQCGLDMCSTCFNGHLHPFHTHRLRIAKPEIVYRKTEGQWRCDACHRVNTPDNGRAAYHCEKCELDLCETCFTGQQSHPLHRQHNLIPVNPQILYRLHHSWSCDNCEQTFNSTHDVTFFHCAQCTFDLCENCYIGKKHHLHPHNLTRLSPSQHSSLPCSNCQQHSSMYTCTLDQCAYTLCEGCYKATPRPHPLHVHPLEICDARLVYPQSGGLWHCDNCTRSNPAGRQTPLPPEQLMYHCDQCEFDLCEPCYKRRELISRPYNQAGRPSHEQRSRQRPYEQPPRQPSYELGTYDPRPPATTAMLCLLCSRRPASHTFTHGPRRCTLVAIVCEGCSEDVLLDRKLCPYCREVPDKAERL